MKRLLVVQQDELHQARQWNIHGLGTLDIAVISGSPLVDLGDDWAMYRAVEKMMGRIIYRES